MVRICKNGPLLICPGLANAFLFEFLVPINGRSCQLHTLYVIIEASFITSACIFLFFRCYECNEKLSTHCNKKVLAQIVDFLQKHAFKTQTGNLSNL